MNDKLNAMKAVYTYFFPEVRTIMNNCLLHNNMLFVTSPNSVTDYIKMLSSNHIEFSPTEEGFVNLDEMHEPIINRICEIYKGVTVGINDFKYRYPTSGSSEGLFHILAKMKADGVQEICVFDGEYEGYEAQAKNLGIKVAKVPFDAYHIVRDCHWFISNPSAMHGNIIPNDIITTMCENGNKIVLDFAYVGSTRKFRFECLHENITHVALSFSKPYGVFRYRIGYTFAREEVPSLYGNKWFKDIERQIQALLIADRIGPEMLWPVYMDKQAKIVEYLNKKFNLFLKTSDALLLAYQPRFKNAQEPLLEQYARGEYYRLCLTPYYEMLEKNADLFLQ